MRESREAPWVPPPPALLFCPADRPERARKASERADGVILDLEDGVAPAAKEAAREALLAVLPELDPARTIVRVNAPGSEWVEADLEALRGAGVRTAMLPKAEAAGQLEPLAPLRAVALCETAAGVLAAPELARHPACAALMWGGEDLIADLGGRSSRGGSGYREVVRHARAAVLLAAGAAGRPAIDAIHAEIDDLDGVRAEAGEAAACGFAAKACIHPGQVAPIREAFGPDGEEVAWARGVLGAAEQAEGAFAYEGRMIDEPLLRHARATLVAAAQQRKEGQQR